MNILNLINKNEYKKLINVFNEKNINKEIINGKKIIHLLSARGKTDVIKKLEEKIPTLNKYIVDNDGNTIFHILLVNGWYDYNFIKNNIDCLTKINNFNETILFYCIDNYIFLKKMLKLYNKNKKDYLFNKKSIKYEQSIIHLIIKKSLINKKYCKLLSLIFEKLDLDEDYIFYCIKKNSEDCFDFFLNKMNDLNIKKNGIPILTYSIVFENNNITKKLLNSNKNLDINYAGFEQRFLPINSAISYKNNEILNILLNHKLIDLNKKNYDNKLPIYNLINNWEIEDNFTNENLKLIFSKNYNKEIYSLLNDKQIKILKKLNIKMSSNLEKIKNTSKINFIGKKNNKGLFNSDPVHSMIYTIEMIKKHKNLLIPIQINNSKKIYDNYLLNLIYVENNKNSFRISELVKIYNNLFYNLIPHVIIWKSINQNYINEDIIFYLKILKKSKCRFIMLKLTLLLESSTHANMILYDTNNKKVIRFEPYGDDHVTDGKELDDKINNIFLQVDNKIKYIRPSDYLKNTEWQTISKGSEEDENLIADPSGFCLCWCYWFLELKLNNPDLDEKDLMLLAYNSIKDHNVDYGNKYLITIRDFSKYLDEMKNNFFKKLKIPERVYYKTTYDEKYLKKIIKNINEQMIDIFLNRIKS